MRNPSTTPAVPSRRRSRRLPILAALVASVVALLLGAWLLLSTRREPTEVGLGPAVLLAGQDRNGDRAMLALHWRERGPPSPAGSRSLSARPAGFGFVLGTSGAGDRALLVYADRVLIAASTVVAGLIVAFAAVRVRRRVPPVHCPACGYDCRATPGRCPECGMELARTAGTDPAREATTKSL